MTNSKQLSGIDTQKQLGKYEYSEYVCCGARAFDSFGNPCETFWITWLFDGVKTGGFDSALSARSWADNYCAKKGLKTVR